MSQTLRVIRRQCIWTLLGALVLFNLPIGAQETVGRVIGVVTDPSGSVVPHAKVTVTNVDTGANSETSTGTDGSYQVLLLPVGTYRVSAEAQGFRKSVTSVQKLEINQSLKIDVKLEVGTTSETVQVEANASGVETVVATLGSVISGSQISEAPLDGRNVLDLATLLPGVIPAQDGGSHAHFNVAGGRGDSVTYLLDGAMNNDLLSNDYVANPNPDAVEEFRILTSNYNAEYGRNGAGIVSVVTKGGTNEFHGVLFDYIRNNDFNANSFFNNQQAIPKDILKRNQFGAEIGGPVWIPKVFNGRNRLFFMTSWQSQRLTGLLTNGEVTVFTPAELQGNFSHSGPNGGPDPRVVNYLEEFPYFQPNPTLAAEGIIDPSKINPVSQNYIKANLIPSSPTGTLFQQGPTLNNNDEITERVDLVASVNDRISLTLHGYRQNQLNPNGLGNPSGNGGTYNNGFGGNRYLGSVAYTKTLSPVMVNEFRFSAQRNDIRQDYPGSKLPTASELGVGLTPDQPTGPPILCFYDDGYCTGFSPNGPTQLINNTYVWSDTFSWQKGSHALKMGFSYTPFQNNTTYDFYVNGDFDFYGQSGGGSFSQNDRADFLMGLPDDLYEAPRAPSDIRTHTLAGFFQDEWKVRTNLTLTLGLRYEYSSPKLDTQGRSFSLDIGQQSSVFPGAPPGILFPGDPGAPRGSNFPDKDNFAPRFGFAWDPKGDGKTSIRGGGGIFYDILKGEDNLQFNGQPPFFGYAFFFFNPLSANPTSPSNYLSAPFVANGTPDPFPSQPPNHDISFANAGLVPVGGAGLFYVDPHLKTPYIYQSNLSIQRELMKDMTLEVSYIGSDSHGLTALKDADPFPIGSNTRLFDLNPAVLAYEAANQVSQAFTFMPEFNNVVNANYNSLAVGLNKRFGETKIGNVQLQFSWTYGHSIDNASGFRSTNSQVPAWDWERFRADSDFDLRHYIAFSGTWELPFYKMWSSGPTRLTKGWSLYPIITFRTGAPMTIFSGLSTQSTDPGPSGAGDQGLILANQVNPVTYFNPKQTQTLDNQNIGGPASGNYWFNPDAFNAVYPAGVYTYGTSGRNEYRGPDQFNVNLSLAKTTSITERTHLEIRADFFNAFNHAEFGLPSTNIGSSTFGQISTTASPRVIQLAARLSF